MRRTAALLKRRQRITSHFDSSLLLMVLVARWMSALKNGYQGQTVSTMRVPVLQTIMDNIGLTTGWA